MIQLFKRIKCNTEMSDSNSEDFVMNPWDERMWELYTDPNKGLYNYKDSEEEVSEKHNFTVL